MPLVYKKDGIKLLHVHIPKTGGSSVTNIFKRNNWNISYVGGHTVPCSAQHQHYDVYKDSIVFSDYLFGFTVVRHPIDRFVSEYNYKKVRNPINEWTQKVLSEYSTNPFILDNHLRPQTEFVPNTLHVFKFEQGIDHIMKSIESRVGKSILHKKVKSNVSTKKATINDLSDVSLELLYQFYQQDFERFEYEKIP